MADTNPTLTPRLESVVLRHDLPDAGHHYDWLIENPRTLTLPDALLWAVRMDQLPRDWPRPGRLALVPLPPHRRLYLTFQGPIARNRGTVTRVDHGHILALSWLDQSMVLDVRLQGFQGVIQIMPGECDDLKLLIEHGSARA